MNRAFALVRPQTWILAWVLVMLGAMAGCSTQPQRLVFDRFPQAYRLSNDTVQIIVVPQIGRVVSFSQVDGRGQMLWWNPSVDTQAKWVNWGGDKAWPWSQEDWGSVWGAIWPPPPALDGRPYTLTHADARSLRMASSIDPTQGLQLEWEITLDASGTGVTMRYTLIRRSPAQGPAWGAWSVTQIPIPDILLARIPAEREPQVQAMSPGQNWRAVTQVAENVLKFERDPTVKAKLGLDADRFLAVKGDWAISITLDPATTQGPWVATEKAQLYSTSDPLDPRLQNRAHVELEFTSPRSPLAKVGERVTLVTRWELHHRPGATLADWVRIVADQAH